MNNTEHMTYYDILQVLPTASPEVIQMAYKALAKKYHPDVYPGDKTVAETLMKLINESYQILSSPQSRAEYDKYLAQKQEKRPEHNTSPNRKQAPPTQPNKEQPKQEAVVSEASKATYKRRLPIVIICVLLILIIGLICKLSDFLRPDTQTNNNDTHIETTSSTRSSASATTTKAKPHLEPVDAPKSGTILSGSKHLNGSEITVTASYTSDCVVKLKTLSGASRLSFYVRAGDTITVGVPPEVLYVYFASGETWYGEDHLFGENTYYSKDQSPVDFEEYTISYTLTPVTNGNFSAHPVDADEFN